MASWLDWLQIIARPVVQLLRAKLNVLSLGVGDMVHELAQGVFGAVTAQRRDGAQQCIATLATAPDEAMRVSSSRIVVELAPDAPVEVQVVMTSFLAELPARIRQALRRPTDPSGTTFPPGLIVSRPEDLVTFLPTRQPRFKPQDRPLPDRDWELQELLGVGGFGEVWKAWKPRFPGVAPRALKFCTAPAAQQRLFRHEADVLGGVMRRGPHEGIVQLLDTYLEADPPCLAYEYVPGCDLAGFIHQNYRAAGGAPPAQATGIIKNLSTTLAYAHQASPPVVHRDLKPANVLVAAKEGQYLFKIADFGIGSLAAEEAINQQARGATSRGLMHAETVRGSYTLLYASPQQLRNERPDVRDDVYALGVIWYQLLTGELGDGRPGGDRWKVRLRDKGMRADHVDVLASCFEDRREDRPDDAGDLLRRIEGRPALALTPAPPEPAPPRSAPFPGEEIVSTTAVAFPAAPDAGHAKAGNAPAIALIASSSLIALISLVVAIALFGDAPGRAGFGFAFLLALPFAAAGIVAGVFMLQRRSPPLVQSLCLVPAASSLLALVFPYDPGRVLFFLLFAALSVSTGVWALRVLRRTEVPVALRARQ